MGWIVFALWLLLTPIWITYWLAPGSSSKTAFIPPALVLIALAFRWLWKHFVVLVAGEAEPQPGGTIQEAAANWRREADLVFRPKRTLHPVWGLALPSSSTTRMSLIAAAAGACVGAAVALDWTTHERAVATNEPAFNTAASRPTDRSDAPIRVRTEAVKSPPVSATPEIQSNSLATSSAGNPPLRRAEVQPPSTNSQSSNAQSSSDQPGCDVSLCERYYRSFRASDCTYQPYGGPRQYCAR
jgi:BA14K-like protein